LCIWSMHCVQNTYCVGKPQDIHLLASPTGSYSWIIFSESSHNSQDGLTDKCTVSKGLLVKSKFVIEKYLDCSSFLHTKMMQ
jgi:hypothetical protein